MARRKTKQQRKEGRRSGPAQRAESERWTRILIIGSAVALLLVVAGVIGFGWYQTQVKPLRKTVLQVGDTKFSLGHLERRMSLMLKENTYFLQSTDLLEALPDTVVTRLEREGKLLEAADEIGVTVTDEEVAQRIGQDGGLSAQAAPDMYARVLRQQVDDSGLKLDEYQQMIRAELLEGKARDHFEASAGESEPQVRARWLAFDTEQQAAEAVQRLEAGEDLDAIAKDPPTGAEDSGSDATPEGNEAGDAAQKADALEVTEVDWTPRGFFPAQEVEDFLFQAEDGEFSEPIEVGLGYYVVKLVERDEDRKLDDEQKTQVANRDLADWLESLDETLTVVQDFTTDDAIRALKDVV